MLVYYDIRYVQINIQVLKLRTFETAHRQRNIGQSSTRYRYQLDHRKNGRFLLARVIRLIRTGGHSYCFQRYTTVHDLYFN
jgi:hypothetical protein